MVSGAAPTQTEPSSTQAAAGNGAPLLTPLQRRGIRASIWGQVFGCLGYLSFSNQTMFLYLAKQEFTSATIVILIALPGIVQALSLIPCSFIADRRGKKAMGMWGCAVMAGGFTAVTCAGFVQPPYSWAAIAAGIVAYGLGQAMFSASWFALLSPLVPVEIRGRYFGTMRLSWQIAGIVFGLAASSFLAKDSPMLTYQIIFGIVTAGMFVRVALYGYIPELEAAKPSGRGLLASVVEIVRVNGYASFCCYVFLITLVTFGGPSLFALVEKDYLHFGDNTIGWMGNLYMIGSMFGFVAGGWMVDRLGTKPVFLICHFTYGLVLFLFLIRHLSPVPAEIYLGALNGVYGLVWAASTIAVSTEMLALIPPENKSLSTGLCQTLLMAGQALAGALSAGAINLGLFRVGWKFLGGVMSDYDAQLLLNATLVVILVVALGLVPSVVRKAEWVPKGD
ncbi:MAG: MFS transporter [Planctomycetota bacterium]|nr:MFS transporter [Planctomycetota bacterium]